MNTPLFSWFGLVRGTLPALLAAAATSVHAADIFWTGPTNLFVHDALSSTVDKLTTNHVGPDSINNVWLTRGTRKPLYNAAAESGWNALTLTSPTNTLWHLASGPLTGAASLPNYGTFANIVGAPGDSPGLSVGQTFFVKIVSDNIYLSLKLESWGNNNGGSFSYSRSSPAVDAAPTVTINITNPVDNAVFAAPADVKLGVNASASSGTVTNVEFLSNGVSIGSVTSSPFSLVASGLPAGPYAFTAVATGAGISATSTPVNITVVNPVDIILSGATSANGQFSFNYTANPGLAYLIQRSSNFADWAPLATNVPGGNPATFSDPVDPVGPRFYRVGRLPNP